MGAGVEAEERQARSVIGAAPGEWLPLGLLAATAGSAARAGWTWG